MGDTVVATKDSVGAPGVTVDVKSKTPMEQGTLEN
jgi:hypothetical protein